MEAIMFSAGTGNARCSDYDVMVDSQRRLPSNNITLYGDVQDMISV